MISGLTEEGEPPPEPPPKNPVLQPHSEMISGLTEEGEPLSEPPHKYSSFRRDFRSYRGGRTSFRTLSFSPIQKRFPVLPRRKNLLQNLLIKTLSFSPIQKRNPVLPRRENLLIKTLSFNLI
jgi:hypothetical protein